MAAQPLKPAYLITGSDEPKVAVAVRRLRARFAEGSVELLSADSVSGTEAVAAANALGLFGGGERLVVVDGIERWKQACMQGLGAPKAETDMKETRQKLLKLEKEIQRKDKALAEAAALLILQKKVQALWAEDAES